MADNLSVTSSSTVAVAARVGTYSGDASQAAQAVVPVIATGSDDSKTLTDVVPIAAALDSTGGGIQAVGVVAQLDDTSPSSVTENQFAPVRMSSRRALLTEDVVAHDGVDAGNPTKIGGRAIAHGTNPTAVAAADRTDWLFNRAGIPWVIGGHPNVVTSSARITGSNTDAAIIAGTISAGTKVVVTRITILNSNATTVNVGCKLGFGASTLAADSTTGATGILVDNDGIPPGGGVQVGTGAGILGVGGDGEEIRVTNDAPTSGSLIISVSYYTVES